MFSTLLCIILGLPLLFYFYIKWRYNHWQKKGVYTIEPEFPYGNIKDVKKGKISQFDFFKKFYNDVKKRGLKYGGVYVGTEPNWVPVDQDLIKQIMLKDFPHFTDHGIYSNTKADPLTGGLFLLEGETWRNHRAKLTPTFTSGKMKMMFNTLVECTKGLEELLEQEASTGEPIFIKEILARFTTDIIGNVAFGLECNCMKVPDNEFRQKCTKAFGIEGKLKRFIYRNAPYWFLRAINFKQNNPEVEKFFFDLVGSTVKYREENNVYRKDFLQMLIELKNTGTVSNDENSKKVTKATGTPFFTLSEITAHSFTFFLAGFETSSTTMSFAIVELGKNQDIQDKVRKEILKVLEKYNGELTYDAISEMNYLEYTLLETLRMYPPIPLLPRICTKTYNVPGTDVVIEEGTKVQLVVNGIHEDPEIYPDPKKFNPDRWSPENNENKPNPLFLSFGDGPRLCIGMRFGKIQAKCGLITLLKNYRIKLSDKMELPVKLIPHFITSVQGGVWVDLEKLKK